MGWWKVGTDGITESKRGLEALGVPCLWKFFGIECALCQRARKYYSQGDDEMGSKFWPKKTAMALAWVFSDHEALEDVNQKLVVTALPIDQVAGAIVQRLSEGSWEVDPSDLERGFVVGIYKKKVEGKQFPKWFIEKGKELPVNRDKLIEAYKELEIVSPRQDKGAFLNWLYNKHPERVLVAGTDIPLNVKVGIRIVPWPYWEGGNPVPEPEVYKDIPPIKTLRFHWGLSDQSFEKLKAREFSLTEEPEDDEADVPLDFDEI